MKKKYLQFCDLIAKACGAFAVLALLLSILVIVELVFERYFFQRAITCLLYTSDAADEGLGVDLGGRRIIKKK